jgi:TrkA-N domain
VFIVHVLEPLRDGQVGFADFDEFDVPLDRHIIVSGDDALATTIVEELTSAGASVVKLADAGIARALARAGIDRALAVACAGDDDSTNLEIALLARKVNPDVRVVVRLDNDVVRGAMAANNGPGAILDVADLAAPSVVEACLARTMHPFEAAGIKFVFWGSEAPRDGTLRDIHGDLAPVAVVRGANSDTPGEVLACPGRDLGVQPGDWTVMIGTAEELAARGINDCNPTVTRSRWPLLRRVLDAARTARDDVNPAFYPASAGRAGLADWLDDPLALVLSPAPRDDVARRVVLQRRDDHDRGLRRRQLRPAAHLAANVQRRTDVCRYGHHGRCGGFRS